PEFTRGEQMWDYLYSMDAGRALYLLGEKGVDGKTYVLGSGSARPLREYMEVIRDICAPGAALGIGALPYGRNQIMYLKADISEVRKDTGWMPEVTFEEGIRNLVLTWG
ncbi:MAG: NAD(P)-dependent oxidoreductase, partial [Lachnospiraceae bacterium]|nr:NAD(P)-dependent oxidoreductase [Candidatus Hippenecus merdae]